jgi:hypothetical protein
VLQEQAPSHILRALVRGGKDVLLIDQTDVYGSGEASFTLEGLMGSSDPQLNPNIQSAASTDSLKGQLLPIPGHQQVLALYLSASFSNALHVRRAERPTPQLLSCTLKATAPVVLLVPTVGAHSASLSSAFQG